MKKYNWSLIVVILTITGIVILLSGCSRSDVSSPAADTETSSATTTTTTPLVIGGGLLNPPIPNPGAFIGSGNVASANTEAAEIKSGAQSFYMETGGYPSYSGDLVNRYVHVTPKANYYFDRATGEIIRVESVAGGWSGIVFSLSVQKWIKGSPDNNHASDLDVP